MRGTVFGILGLLVAIPSLAGAQQDRTTDSAVADFQKDFAAAYNRGDYSVRRVISRSEGSFSFNAGEWQAKLGDQPFRGYYTAIVVQDGGETKILEETVTVAAP
jgi:hypothetical protein